MGNERSNVTFPDKTLAAVCGLFCPSCTFYIASTEDPARLQKLSSRLGRAAEEMECHGCRSDRLGLYCKKYCKMKKCASAKGIDFCGECGEYPCSDLKEFQAQMPHRIELWDAHARIKSAGYETWYGEMVQHYSCPSRGTINSAYDLSCWKCGRQPGCEYVRKHQGEIMQAINKLVT